MGELDGWAVAIGTATCRYLSRNDHDTFFRALCSDGSSSAGWKLVISILLFAAVTFGMFRLFRPS